MSEYMPERMSDRMSECQKPFQNTVSRCGSLKESNFHIMVIFVVPLLAKKLNVCVQRRKGCVICPPCHLTAQRCRQVAPGIFHTSFLTEARRIQLIQLEQVLAAPCPTQPAQWPKQFQTTNPKYQQILETTRPLQIGPLIDYP